jgi:hypothetical protein
MAHCQLAKAPYWTCPVMSQITKEASLPTTEKGVPNKSFHRIGEKRRSPPGELIVSPRNPQLIYEHQFLIRA